MDESATGSVNFLWSANGSTTAKARRASQSRPLRVHDEDDEACYALEQASRDDLPGLFRRFESEVLV